MNAAAAASPRFAPDARWIACRVASFAIRSLHAELVLYPKPGLVSPRDDGAHTDMTAATFMRSIAALRGYFVEVALAGVQGAPFGELRRLGIAAERRMLRATGGINTHRGAIFALGLLSAAAGRLGAARCRATDEALREALHAWHNDLVASDVERAAPPSHGRLAALRYRAAGARGEAARGFPGVFGVGVPALRVALGRGAAADVAQIHALFALLARVEDTNVLHRGGPAALEFVQREAAAFIGAGSVFAQDWHTRAERLHRALCALRISPGGSADLLGACWFVHQLQSDG